MALSGTFSKVYEGYTYKILWSASQSTSGNYSTITCTHKLVCASGWALYISSRSNTCVVGSDSKTFTSAAINTSGGSTITLGTTTHTVNHNTDGTGSFSLTGTFKMQATISGTYVSSIVVTGSATLDTILRSSSITSASNITLGNKCSIKWTPASTNFKYKIKFSLGDWYYTTGYISPATTSAYTYSDYTISGTTTANSTTIYAQLPKSTSGTMTATLTTYNSSGTQIGSSSSKTFTVTIPSSVVPTVGTIKLTPVTINNNSILVQGKNKVTISVSNCTAGTGSSIKSYTFSGPSGSSIITSTTTSTSVTWGPISSSGTKTYTVTVTDARGRTASKTKSITCYAYSPPYFNTFEAYRSNSSGEADANGEYIKCSYDLTYSSVNDTNDITVQILYKKNTDPSYSSLIVLSDDTTTSGNKILESISLNSTYTVYATITDNYSGSSPSTTITIFGQSRILNITQDGTGVAVGKMAESSELFDCRWPMRANGFDIPQIQKGVVKITSSAANTPTSKIVTFEHSFSGIPVVTATPYTAVPGTYTLGVGIQNPNASGVTIYLTRTDTGTTNIGWIAAY